MFGAGAHVAAAAGVIERHQRTRETVGVAVSRATAALVREWMSERLEAEGARITARGGGTDGQEELLFVVEGREYRLSIEPVRQS